jgi:hypothetical protein
MAEGTDRTQNEDPSGNTLRRRIRTIGIALVLGAIGSGLWEVLLRPACVATGNGLLTLLSRTANGYVDALHEPIANGHAGHEALHVFTIGSMLLLSSYWLAVIVLRSMMDRLVHKVEERPMPQSLGSRLLAGSGALPVRARRLRRRSTVVMVVLASLTSVLVLEGVFRAMYEWRAVTFVERSLDILAPKMAESERLRLRAQYRSIGSAGDFYALEDALRGEATKQSVTLPEFGSVR